MVRSMAEELAYCIARVKAFEFAQAASRVELLGIAPNPSIENSAVSAKKVKTRSILFYILIVLIIIMYRKKRILLQIFLNSYTE